MSGAAPSTVLFSARTLGSVPPAATLQTYTSLTLPGTFVLAANTSYAVTVSPQTLSTSATLALIQVNSAPTSAAGLTSIALQSWNGATWASGGTTHFGFRLHDSASVAFAGTQTWFDMQTGNTACADVGTCSNMPAQANGVTFSSGLTNFAIGFTAPFDGEPVSFGLTSVAVALWGGSTGGFSGVTATARLFAGVVGSTPTTQGLVAPSGLAIATTTAAVPTCAANAGIFFTLATE